MQSGLLARSNPNARADHRLFDVLEMGLIGLLAVSQAFESQMTSIRLASCKQANLLPPNAPEIGVLNLTLDVVEDCRDKAGPPWTALS